MTTEQPIEAPTAGPNWWNRALLAAVWAAILPGLYFAREFRFETFHDLVGVFCTVTAGAVFIVAWNSRHLGANNYLTVVGVAYVFVAALNVVHVTFPSPIPGEHNFPSELSLAGRTLQGLTLLAAAILLRMRRPVSPRAVFLVGLITAAAGVAIIVRGNILPPVYSGHVPTPFAHALYGALCVVQALALGMLLERRRAFTPRTLRLLTASLALTLASDVSLTLDANPNGWAFLLSHYLSILALYPLYMAFVEIGLDRPLRQLRESEHRYRALFESAPVGLCITTWGGKMVALNQRLREALALGDAPCERITLKDLMQSDERRLLLAELQERGRVAGWQATLRRSDGAWIPADVSVEPVRLDGQEVLLVTIADQSLQRRLEAEVLSIGEAQSRRIGRDLHDSLGQALTSTAFLAGVLTRKLSARELPEASDAKRIEALLAESVDTTRSLAQGLSPVGLRGDGFLAGLKDLADRTQETFGIACHARLDDACAVQDAVLASHLYRIAQEALTNAVKHAGPKNVWIELAREGGALRLSVRDDGQGLGPREAAGDGMGLRIMRYRANSVGGSLEVRRPSEGGTEVCCLLPAQALTRSNHE